MKLKKTTISLLAITLLSTFVLANVPLAKAVDWGTITWLSLWTEPDYAYYWELAIAAYKAERAKQGITVNVRLDSVEFVNLYSTIMLEKAAGTDHDLLHMHSMWVPAFANWRTKVIAEPPTAVVADINANWESGGIAGNMFKGQVWGYPSEFDSWALLYDRVVIQNRIDELTGADKTFLAGVLAKLEADTPLHWDLTENSEVVRAAKLLTKWDTSVSPAIQTQWGFVPFVEGMDEEQRYQFMSMYYSNGGGEPYIDTSLPEATFDNVNGREVMQLYHNLGFEIDTDPADGLQPVYDPLHFPDYWWDAWVYETIGMSILPTWMAYLQFAMVNEETGESYWDNIGISPIPIGPHGTESKSASFTWVTAVTQKAVERGTATAAWDFLTWINAPHKAGSVADDTTSDYSFGYIPRADDVSIMGDFLIYHVIGTSRANDALYGRMWDPTQPHSIGERIADNFWYQGFNKFREPPYVAPDETILKGQEVQYNVGLMFEGVTLGGADPTTAVNDAKAAIDDILVMSGDVTINGIVDIFDVPLMAADIGAVPYTTQWNRGRCEFASDPTETPPIVISVLDIAIITMNYGRTGGSL